MGQSAGSLRGGTYEASEHAIQEEIENAGPDPVIGAGIALLGIFLMGVGGARDAHFLFNAGVGIAVIGAIVFVLFVTVSALKLRRAHAGEGEAEGEAPPG